MTTYWTEQVDAAVCEGQCSRVMLKSWSIKNPQAGNWIFVTCELEKGMWLCTTRDLLRIIT